jgi:hypothetical protein
MLDLTRKNSLLPYKVSSIAEQHHIDAAPGEGGMMMKFFFI